MNVLIIGAAGRTGRLAVKLASAAGHKVTAFVRSAESPRTAAPEVRVVAGDATDVAPLSDAMVGQDAVIDTVGGKTPFLNSDLESNVAVAVVAAMKRRGVKRLVAVSAVGVGDSRAQGTFFFRRIVLPLFLRGSTRDKEAMEKVVRESGLEFIVVRPAVLNDHESAGPARVFLDGRKVNEITRTDVAQFLVEQLQGDRYLGQAVTISNA
jgi:uncharacterized protein YbjT (DUF2867 family)